MAKTQKPKAKAKPKASPKTEATQQLPPWVKAYGPLALVVLILMAVSMVYYSPVLQGKVLPQPDVVRAEGGQQDLFEYEEATGERAFWTENSFSGMPAVTIYQEYKGNLGEEVSTWLHLGLPYPIGYFFWGMLFFFALLRVRQVSIALALAGAFAYGFFSYHVMIIEAGHYNKFLVLMTAPGILWALELAFNGRRWLGGALLALLLAMQIFLSHIQMTYYLLFVVVLYAIYQLQAHVVQHKLKDFARTAVPLVLAGVVALLVNTAPLLPLYDYTQVSTRGPSELASSSKQAQDGGLDRDYAYNWSYGRQEMATLLVPYAAGGPSSGGTLDDGSVAYQALQQQGVPNAGALINQLPTYWGVQPFTGGPFYLGAGIVLLFFVGLMLVKDGIRMALLYSALLGVLLALGSESISLWLSVVLLSLPLAHHLLKERMRKYLSPSAFGLALAVLGYIMIVALDPGPRASYSISDFFFDYAPLYDKFRVPSSMLVILAFSVPWLALLGAKELLNPERDKHERMMALYYSVATVGGICLLWALTPQFFFGFETSADARLGLPPWLTGALYEDRANLLRADAFRSLVFVLLIGALVWAYLTARIKQVSVVAGGIAVLVLFDLWFVDLRLLNDDDYQRKQEYSSQFQPRAADQLILQDTSYYRVFPASRSAFQDGISPYFHRSVGGYSAAKVGRYQDLIEAHLSQAKPNVVNMLNVRYAIFSDSVRSPQYALVGQGQGELVYRNRFNYGPAWLVQNLALVPTPDAALDTLDALSSLNTAVVEQSQAELLGSYSTDSLADNESITLVSHSNNAIEYAYSSPKARFVTFSEVYVPKGWTASIDGEEVPIIRTNYVLRGLVVPAGEHRIRFTYAPAVISRSENLSMVGSVLLVVYLLFAGFVTYREQRKPAPLVEPA